MARELVSELLDLAILAPNHHETEPWRFWVVGRETLEALADATGDKKLLRSHTAIVVGVKRDDDEQTAEEDYAAVSCAIQNLMLAARALERGVDAFNSSAYRRTVASIAKGLGVPRASVVVLSGSRPDAIVTVAWEISWYQYRVEAERGGHVRLEDRGDDPGAIDQRWRDWNAQVAPDGQLTLV